MNNRKITFGRWEAVSLLITMISAKAVLNFPRTVIEEGGTAGWLTVIFISVTALVCFVIIAKLYASFNRKDLIDIGEDLGGSAGRIIIGIIVVFFLINLMSTVFREFGEQMKIIAFKNSPISFVLLFFVAGVIAASFMGIEAIVRIQSILVPIVVVSYITYIIMLSPYMDISKITPILGNGVQAIFGKGFFRLSEYGELIFLFLLVPFIKTQKNFRAIGYTAIGLNAFFFLSITLTYLLIYSYPIAIENTIPVYQLGLVINYSRFFQRIEALFVTTWAFVGLMYLSTGFYFLIYIFKKTFKLEYTRPLIFPFAVLVFTLSLLPQNLVVTIDQEVDVFRNWAWIITFAMTILLLLAAKILKKGGKQN